MNIERNFTASETTIKNKIASGIASEIRAAVWASRAIRRAKSLVNNSGVADLNLPHAPSLGRRGLRGVEGMLRRAEATCLVRSAVLQRWYADQGDYRDLVVGVTSPKDGFRAHAWLEPPGDPSAQDFVEVLRLPAAGT